MKFLIVCLFIVSTFGFISEQKEKSIVGKWKIKSWINLDNNSDFIKDYSVDYHVTFSSDSVYIIEKEGNQLNDYIRGYELKKDSIYVKWLGAFRIIHLDENKLILNHTTNYIFTEDPTLHDEVLTLIKCLD